MNDQPKQQPADDDSKRLSRRKFLGTGGVLGSAAALGLNARLGAADDQINGDKPESQSTDAASAKESSGRDSQPSQDTSGQRTDLIEQSHRFDVVVIGGGVAGVCAAVASARHGSRTAVVHNRPVFGGNSSTEIRIPILSAGNYNPLAVETGIGYELIVEERSRSHDPAGTGMVNAQWDLTLYEAVRREPNLKYFLNANVYETVTDGDRITEVTALQLGTEKRLRFAADMFVDCTGDGLIGTQAGVPFRIGQEPRHQYGESLAPKTGWDWTMGNSLMFRSRDAGRPVEFHAPDWAVRYDSEDAFRFRPLGAGKSGYWWIELGWPDDTIADNEKLRDKLLAHVLGIWNYLKNHSKKHKELLRNYALDWVGMVPGKRESRRFVGAHVMTQPEIQRRKLYRDRIGFGGWIIDDHLKQGIQVLDKKPSFDDVSIESCMVAPYSVPLRSLFAGEVSNLFFAGRDMSASRVVFCSLRVQSTLGPIGQAAGTAAAFCAARKRKPIELTGGEVAAIQQALLRDGVYIPHLAGNDTNDLAGHAKMTASSQAALIAEPGKNDFDLVRPAAQLLPINNTRLESVEVYLENRTSKDVTLRARLIPAKDVWDVAALDAPRPIAESKATLSAGDKWWVKFSFDLAAGSKSRLFWLEIAKAKGVRWSYSEPALVGLSAACRKEERWWFAPGAFHECQTFAVRVSPTVYPYGPENVVNGVARPECGPNLWMSDPAKKLPQHVGLRFRRPVTIGCVQVTFDTNLSRSPSAMPPLFHAPECVRDYTILAKQAGRWVEMVRVEGNYHRRRRHTMKPTHTTAVRVRIDATNGVPEARVYEVRCYPPDAIS